MSTCELLDYRYRRVTIDWADVVRVDHAPSQGGVIECADRVELNDGRVLWGLGNRSWYDEHRLQGGLRTIHYPGRDVSTRKGEP